MNLDNPYDELVNYCPIRGHMPLCTKGACKVEKDKNNWENCKKHFENKPPYEPFGGSSV
jgi:hypothetical protein